MSRLSTPWTRVHLARGRSSGDLWEVDRSTSGARIDVGSSPNCVWQVHAPGVRPFHLEMYWDGEVLWVADLEGAKVRIDGQVVDDWYATAHGTRIELGQATLRVETSQQEFDDPHVADAFEEVTTDRSPNRTFGDTATDVSAPADPLHDAPTRVAGAGESALASAERAARGESRLDGTPTRAAAPRGRGDPAEAAVFGGAAADDPNATRLVQTPESRLEGAPGVPIHRRPPPPRIGAGAHNVRRASSPNDATSARPAARRAPRSAPPPPPPPPRNAPPPSTPPPAPKTSEPPPAAPDARPGPRDEAPAAATSNKPRFAAPPPLDAGKQKRKASESGDGPKKPVIGGKQMSLPPRTWALLAATVGALAYVILMEDEPPAEPPAAPVAAEAATEEEEPVDEPGERDEGGEQDGDADEAGDGETRELGARPDEATEAPVAETAEATEDEPEDEVDRTLVRRAADAIMDGRRREALELYRQLAEAQPEEPAFAAIVGILEDRVDDCEEEPCD